MASATQSSSSASPPSLNSCGDSVDIDSFINFDSSLYPSPSISPTNTRGKAAIIQPPTLSNPSSSFTSSQSSQQQLFSGPSHQYEQYKQQTGLPVGGLANTLAFNDMSYGMNSGFAMPSESYFDMGTSDGMYGFSAMNGRSLSVDEGTDLELDMDSPETENLPAYFYPPGKSEFIDPNAVGGQEEPSPPPSNVGRMWPGMHQKQAALAKAAAQQKQQEMIQQQRQRQLEAQQAPQPLPRQNRAAAHQATDPIVEERITRLLHQMRQSSNAGSPDDASTPTGSLPHIAKLKKDEDDMDEDERLLASEEGKKLSSKERRQLRNKVSARAFRSRRKEYISQLEGEVAKAANENIELKNHNRALMEENARLTELTRMLLSSSAFSGFMSELSAEQAPRAPQPSEQSAAQQSLLPNTRKDVNPNQITQHATSMPRQQIGMALMPDIDFSTLDLNAGWNSGMDMTFNNPQVFAVTEVPEGPVIDTELLSGKSSDFTPSFSSAESKEQVPIVERSPVVEKVEETAVAVPSEDIELDESLALFMEVPVVKGTPESEPFDDMFGGIAPEKAFSRLELVITEESADLDVILMERFERMCSSVQDAFQRIASVTSHL